MRTPTRRPPISCRSMASTTSSSGSATPARPRTTTARCGASRRSRSAGSRRRSATGPATSWSRTASASCSRRRSPRTARSPSTSGAWRRRPRHRVRRRRRRVGLARDDDAWRESAMEPTELDGGEDGILRRVRDPDVRRDAPLVRRSARLSRRLRPGLPQGRGAAAGRRGAQPARGRPLRRQRRPGPDGRVRRLLPRRPGLRPAHPLRRQGHPHRLQRADVEGHDQRQRPHQVPDQ